MHGTGLQMKQLAKRIEWTNLDLILEQGDGRPIPKESIKRYTSNYVSKYIGHVAVLTDCDSSGVGIGPWRHQARHRH